MYVEIFHELLLLSYVQLGNFDITFYIKYMTHISVELAHYEIFCAKIGKGGILVRLPIIPNLFAFLLESI